MIRTMKKIYLKPETALVKLYTDGLCQTLGIGSGNTDTGTGNGAVLGKEFDEDEDGDWGTVWEE